jgi:hypothetical protein
MKFNWKLIMSIVLTSIVIGTGFNQVFLKASVIALHQQQFKVMDITNSTPKTANPRNIRPNVQIDLIPTLHPQEYPKPRLLIHFL